MPQKFKVAVLGPKGQCGQCVVDESLSRGYSVVGISRSPPKTWRTPGDYSAITCDFSDIRSLSNILSEGGFDAVVSAFAPPLTDMKAVYRLGVEGHGYIKMAIMRSSYRGPFIIIGIIFNFVDAYKRLVKDFKTNGIFLDCRRCRFLILQARRSVMR